MKIHHVAGLIVIHVDIGLQFFGQSDVVEGVFGGKVGRGKVVKTVGDEDFHGGVRDHRFAQFFCDIDILIFPAVIFPCLIERCQHFIRQVTLERQFAPDIILKGGGIWAIDR